MNEDNILSKEERYIAALKGNKIASEKAKKIVYQYDNNNILIETYESLKEASLKNNINKSTLQSWITGRYKSNSLYKFTYTKK